jgi:hypothetical protein
MADHAPITQVIDACQPSPMPAGDGSAGYLAGFELVASGPAGDGSAGYLAGFEVGASGNAGCAGVAARQGGHASAQGLDPA